MKSYRILAWKELKEQKVMAALILIAVVLSSIMTTAAGEAIGILQAMRQEQAAGLNGDRYASFHQLSREQAKALHQDSRLYQAGNTLTLGSVEIPDSGLTLFLREYDAVSLTIYASACQMKEGRLPERENEIALSGDALTYLAPDASVGDSISLDLSIGRMDGSIPPYEYTAVFLLTGILENNYLGYASGTIDGVAGAGTAKRLLPEPYLLYSTDFKTYSKAEFQDIVYDLMAQLDVPESDVQYNWVLLDAMGISYEDAGNSDTDTGFSFLAFACVLVCVLVLFAAGLVIYNILKISITRRIRNYGTLRAIGGERRQIYWLVSLQLLILCGIGLPIGLLLGLLSAKGILTASAGVLNPELFLADSTESLNQAIAATNTANPLPLLLSVLITLLFAIAAAFPAARYASRVSPVTAMTGQTVKIRRRGGKNMITPSEHTSMPFGKNKVTPSGHTFIPSGAHVPFGKNRVTPSGHTSIPSGAHVPFGKNKVTPSGHTSMPFGKNKVSRPRKIRNFEAWYARLNLRRGGSRTVITLLSLIMSITVFVALQSFTSILDASSSVQGLYPGDYSITNEAAGIPQDAAEQIRTHASVERLSTTNLMIYDPEEELPFTTDISRQSHETLQIAAIDEERLLGYLPDLTAEEQEELLAGTACLVKNPIPFSYGDMEILYTSLNAGDTITLGGMKLRIAGLAENPVTINNNGFTNGIQILVNETIYQKLTGMNYYQEVYPTLKETAEAEAFEQWLGGWTETVPGTHWLSFRQSQEQMAESFAQTKLLCWILIAFIGMIGILNIINTVYSNIHTRIAEIGMQRAIGMSRKSLYRTFLWEGAWYGITASAIGAVLGYLCTIVIGAAQSDELQLVPIPLAAIVWAALLSIAACLLATAVPLRAISRLHIVEAIETTEQ